MTNIIFVAFLVFALIAFTQKSTGRILVPKSGWIAFGLFCFLLILIVNVPSTPSTLDKYNEKVNQAETIANNIKVKSWSVRLGGYDNILIIDRLTLTNQNHFPVKDILINVKSYAASGTLLNSKDYTIYDIIPANKSKTFRDINLGFVDSQGRKSNIEIVRAFRAE